MAEGRYVISRIGTLPQRDSNPNDCTADREKCLNAEMNDHIGKPIDPDALFSVLLRWAKRPTEISKELPLGA